MTTLEIILDSTVLVAIVGVCGKLLLDWYQNRRKKKKDNAKVSEVIAEMSEVHSVLNNLMLEVDAIRILVLISENGGGKPTAHKPLYSSVLFEAYNPEKTRPVQNGWQKQRLDNSYVEMISLMLSRGGGTFIKTKDLQEGHLKNIYLTNGVVCSKVRIIKDTPMRLYYISINFDRDVEGDPVIRNAVRAAVSNLQTKSWE